MLRGRSQQISFPSLIDHWRPIRPIFMYSLLSSYSSENLQSWCSPLVWQRRSLEQPASRNCLKCVSRWLTEIEYLVGLLSPGSNQPDQLSISQFSIIFFFPHLYYREALLAFSGHLTGRMASALLTSYFHLWVVSRARHIVSDASPSKVRPVQAQFLIKQDMHIKRIYH